MMTRREILNTAVSYEHTKIKSLWSRNYNKAGGVSKTFFTLQFYRNLIDSKKLSYLFTRIK